MIKSKEDYIYYINADRIAMGLPPKQDFKSRIYHFFIPDYRYKYQKLMRKIEYRTNVKKGLFNKVALFFLHVKYSKIGLKLLINIYPNTCGPGLNIAHMGPIRISKGVKIGRNCRIHISTNIGIQAGTSDESAIIGDNVYIGPGVKFVKPCIIGDNVAIGANSVVTSSFSEGNVIIAGIPAKIVKDKIDTRKILIAATELIEKGIYDTQGKNSLEIHEKYFS
jgi:serine O-acetyltransferase